MKILTLDDRALKRTRRSRNPTKTSRTERTYARQLKAIAYHVGEIVRGFESGGVEAMPTLADMLRKYAEALKPWAIATARSMVLDIDARDRDSWRSMGNRISDGLREEILNAPTGETLRRLMAEQVTLIQSIPTDAAQRVHDLTIKGLEDSTRSKEIAAEIMRSGDVAASRAMLIARTEVARTATALTQARAQHVGSTEFIWRTSGDGAVRDSHRKLNGKAFRWDDPPECDPGHHALPGSIWNCRCYAEPIIPD